MRLVAHDRPIGLLGEDDPLSRTLLRVIHERTPPNEVEQYLAVEGSRIHSGYILEETDSTVLLLTYWRPTADSRAASKDSSSFDQPSIIKVGRLIRDSRINF